MQILFFEGTEVAAPVVVVFLVCIFFCRRMHSANTKMTIIKCNFLNENPEMRLKRI